jgi:hypothetical protein
MGAIKAGKEKGRNRRGKVIKHALPSTGFFKQQSRKCNLRKDNFFKKAFSSIIKTVLEPRAKEFVYDSCLSDR